MEGVNGWDKHSKLVMDRLDRHDKALDTLNTSIDAVRTKDLPAIRVEMLKQMAEVTNELKEMKVELRSEVATLKERSSIWGGITGAVISVLVGMFRG